MSALNLDKEQVLSLHSSACWCGQLRDPLPLGHGLAGKGRLRERQLHNCFEMLQKFIRNKCTEINTAALGTFQFQAFEIHPLRCFSCYLIYQRPVYLVEPGKLPRDFILFQLIHEHLHP